MCDIIIRRQPFVLTRYLYIKQEVELALLLSLLNKNEESSLFWGYELYYSGFLKELFDLLVKIYYDFYATLNPSFGVYIQKKYNEYIHMKTPIEDRVISMIINNFIIRPFNLDVFMLKKIIQCNIYSADIGDKNDFINYIKNNKFINISNYIYKSGFNNTQLKQLLEITIDYFNSIMINLNKLKILNEWDKNKIIDKKTLLLSMIMYYYSLLFKLKMGKNIYVFVPPEDVVIYETLFADNITKTYRILSSTVIYDINESNYLNLFELTRYNVNFIEAYLNNWLYYASFSPIWSDRIKKYNGTINNELKKIDFNSETLDEDNFYDQYNYEPDEQPTHIQNKSIGVINNNNTWKDFYYKYKGDGLFVIDDKYMNEMNKIIY
jgi:hypothetical protein